MIYRRGWVPVLYKSELEKRLKDEGIENYQQVSTFLCGYDNDTPERYDYQVVDHSVWTERKDAVFWQRLNRLWFVPLWFISIPFQWLFRGKIGVETTSKFGLVMSKLTGLE